jgi:hypothetical protein
MVARVGGKGKRNAAGGIFPRQAINYSFMATHRLDTMYKSCITFSSCAIVLLRHGTRGFRHRGGERREKGRGISACHCSTASQYNRKDGMPPLMINPCISCPTKPSNTLSDLTSVPTHTPHCRLCSLLGFHPRAARSVDDGHREDCASDHEGDNLSP